MKTPKSIIVNRINAKLVSYGYNQAKNNAGRLEIAKNVETALKTELTAAMNLLRSGPLNPMKIIAPTTLALAILTALAANSVPDVPTTAKNPGTAKNPTPAIAQFNAAHSAAITQPISPANNPPTTSVHSPAHTSAPNPATSAQTATAPQLEPTPNTSDATPETPLTASLNTPERLADTQRKTTAPITAPSTASPNTVSMALTPDITEQCGFGRLWGTPHP